MEIDEKQALAAKLREAREYLGLSQQFVANQLGLCRTCVLQIEAGNRDVTALELKQLARLYRRPVGVLLGIEEERELPEAVALVDQHPKLSSHDREEVLKFGRFLQEAGKPRTEAA